MKRIIAVVIIVMISLCFSSCRSSKDMNNSDANVSSGTTSESALDSTIIEEPTNAESKNESAVGEKTEIVEEADYFRITQTGMLFYYELYGDDHNIVFSGGPHTKPPRITMTENRFVRITTQAGTGIETQSGFYYDVQTGTVSSTYNSIFDQACGLVAYATNNKVFVQDIFDKKGFYQEISTFKQPLSQVAFPFTDVRFSEDGSSVYVSFLSGAEYTEVTEKFSLNTEDGSLCY